VLTHNLTNVYVVSVSNQSYNYTEGMVTDI